MLRYRFVWILYFFSTCTLYSGESNATNANLTTEQLATAVLDLENEQNPRATKLFVAALRLDSSNSGMLSDEMSERLVKIVHEGKDWRPAGALNLLLLATQETRDKCLLRVSNSAISRFCQWTYLPQEDSAAVCGIHDLLLLASMKQLNLNAEATKALEQYCQMPTDPRYLNQWSAAPDKIVINHYAAFSILWRNTDPSKALNGTIAGHHARANAEATNQPYAWAFSGLRLADPGEPTINPNDSLGLRGQLTTAWRHPQSDVMLNLTKEALKEKKYHSLVLSKFFNFGHFSDKLSSITGAKELLESNLSTKEYFMDSHSNAQIAFLLSKSFNERAKYIALANTMFQKHYLVDGKIARAWGPWLEFLLRTDPSHEILNQFHNALKESSQPGNEFAWWVLSLRRGHHPPPFPRQSYLRVFDNPHAVDIFEGLAFTAERKLKIIDQLRDPACLLGRFDKGIDPKINGISERNAVLMWMGALDRIEWFARDLPERLSPR